MKDIYHDVDIHKLVKVISSIVDIYKLLKTIIYINAFTYNLKKKHYTIMYHFVCNLEAYCCVSCSMQTSINFWSSSRGSVLSCSVSWSLLIHTASQHLFTVSIHHHATYFLLLLGMNLKKGDIYYNVDIYKIPSVNPSTYK